MITERIHLVPDRKYLKITGLASLVFFTMTFAMFLPGVRDFSGQLTLKVMYFRPIIWTQLLLSITYLGTAWALATMTAIAAILLTLNKYIRDAAFITLTMVLVPLVLIAIKSILSQHPPSSIDETMELNTMLTYPRDYSFG